MLDAMGRCPSDIGMTPAIDVSTCNRWASMDQDCANRVLVIDAEQVVLHGEPDQKRGKG